MGRSRTGYGRMNAESGKEEKRMSAQANINLIRCSLLDEKNAFEPVSQA